MNLRDRLRYYKHVLTAKEKDASWYDAVYSTSAEYHRDHEDSVYVPVWNAIIRRLRTAETETVLDLGCGPGQLAAYLRAEGFTRYTGVDFSATAIEQARARCPDLTFHVADLNVFDLSSLFPVDAVIATEVLEHIKGDLDLLRRLPSGTRFVGSVPTFNAESHVRYFPTRADAMRRYRSVFETLEVDAIETTNGATLYVMDGIR